MSAESLLDLLAASFRRTCGGLPKDWDKIVLAMEEFEAQLRAEKDSLARDDFVAKWRSAIRLFYLGDLGFEYEERTRQNFEADLDALISKVRAEEREMALEEERRGIR